MRLRYTVRAAAELDEVLSFIDLQSPRGAARVKARIRTVIEFVRQYPDCGRPTNHGQLRRVLVYPHPYFIFYRVGAAEIVIHGVRHSARDPRSMPK